MERDQLRQLVAEQVRQALRGGGAAAPVPVQPDGPTVVAVFCGGRGGLSTALAQVKAIGREAHVVGVLTPAAKELVGEERLRKEGGATEIVAADSGVSPWDLIGRADLVLVAQLTRTTLARIALGLSDSFAGTVVLNALWDGTPVMAARDGVEPDLAARDPERAADAPRDLVRLYQEHLARVEAFGCQVIPADRISEAVLAALTGRETRVDRPLKARRVITEEDVKRASRRSEAINVTGAIITPLARDTAEELGVDLIDG